MSFGKGPSVRQLEALVAVIANGSMTAAAADLGISQPAISRLLGDLARKFDFPLFVKRDRQLVASPEVRQLEPEIRRVLELMRRIADVGGDLTNRKAGQLRIACLPGFATSHLPEVVAAFLRDRPDVTMTIEPDRPERILEWMIAEQYDLGITDGFVGHPAIDRTQVRLRTVCVFPEGHRLAALDRVTPADLAGEPVIHTRRDSEFFALLSRRFEEAHVALDSHVEVRQFTAACELVRRGLGVSVVSLLDAEPYEGRGLCHRPFLPALPHVLSIVRPVHKIPSLLTIEFTEAFAASLAPFVAPD